MSSCWGGGALSEERDALALEADVVVVGDVLRVVARVSNGRDGVVHLVPDECGRVTAARLTRTRTDSDGKRWTGSLQAVKEMILGRQVVQQGPDRLRPHPSIGAACQPPGAPVSIEPGAEVVEHWEIELESASTLVEGGPEATDLHVDLLEALDRGVLEPREADVLSDERVLRIEQSLGTIVDDPSPTARSSDKGLLFDRLMEDEGLRKWIEARSSDSWRHAELLTVITDFRERLVLRLVSNEYEAAAVVVAEADASAPTVRLPTTRAKHYERRPAELPLEVATGPLVKGYVATNDLLVGSLHLPSGRLVVGEYLLDRQLSVHVQVEAGDYPIRATLARSGDLEDVALATLILTSDTAERWEPAGTFPVDGGTASFVSAEGRDVLVAALDADARIYAELDQAITDSLIAHDWQATLFRLESDLNLARFRTSIGDGVYPVFVGFDGEDRPTAVVVDFGLLPLLWPVD